MVIFRTIRGESFPARSLIPPFTHPSASILSPVSTLPPSQTSFSKRSGFFPHVLVLQNLAPDPVLFCRRRCRHPGCRDAAFVHCGFTSTSADPQIQHAPIASHSPVTLHRLEYTLWHHGFYFAISPCSSGPRSTLFLHHLDARALLQPHQHFTPTAESLQSLLETD